MPKMKKLVTSNKDFFIGVGVLLATLVPIYGLVKWNKNRQKIEVETQETPESPYVDEVRAGINDPNKIHYHIPNHLQESAKLFVAYNEEKRSIEIEYQNGDHSFDMAQRMGKNDQRLTNAGTIFYQGNNGGVVIGGLLCKAFTKANEPYYSCTKVSVEIGGIDSPDGLKACSYIRDRFEVKVTDDNTITDVTKKSGAERQRRFSFNDPSESTITSIISRAIGGLEPVNHILGIDDFPQERDVIRQFSHCFKANGPK